MRFLLSLLALSLPVAAHAKALYEPSRGAYLGAALDYSDLGTQRPAREAFSAKMAAWETQSGRPNAVYVQFFSFPAQDGVFASWDSDQRGWATAKDFSEAAAQRGAAPLLTLEPFGDPKQFARDWKLGSKAYDATLAFARSVGAWGKPVFIRWAHEMNGSWYPWAEWIDKNKNLKRDAGEDTGFTAESYRASYRNVAQMFRRFAPNVALVWCPNSGLLGGEQRDVFGPWYPGDDLVDWVGLDVYERGWSLPMPGAKLWGGQFRYNLTHDMKDDTSTEANESVNFYQAYAVQKRKPLIICETSATLSYRTDLPAEERAAMNHLWKTGYWNEAEYGWLRALYGTTQAEGPKLSIPIDVSLPQIKAVVWFQIAKRETIPTEKAPGQVVWFNDAWTDYRIGGGVEPNGAQPYAQDELDLLRQLTASRYFLSSIQK